jgi:NAD(P)-dependent dehydrogenase (short-subunit alcohol dehydrogenase family)
MDVGLGGARAVVAGGASGIGRAIALGLLAEGARVAVVDRDTSDLGELRLRCDLSRPEAATDALDQVAAAWGGIDVLVHTPAIARHEPATRITPEAWSATLATNLGACTWMCREAARRMLAHGGTILAIGSTAVYTPAAGESVYRASKAALKAFVEVLAIELAPFGIRANLLTPGAFATGLTAGMTAQQRVALEREIPLRREAAPHELVATALLLLSDSLSPYTTGAEFVVDGGLRLRPMPFAGDEELRRLVAGDIPARTG